MKKKKKVRLGLGLGLVLSYKLMIFKLELYVVTGQGINIVDYKRGVCVPQSCLCHGPIITKVSCAEVTHITTQLWRNMNVWLTAKPVLLLNGLLLWLRPLFLSPTKTAGPDFICYQAREGGK